ncbi:MAG: hypothetical protein H0W70_15245, partial [Actinobacteria bacterium]|nr:hypothetical protein [Actinomycetota bacterium]
MNERLIVWTGRAAWALLPLAAGPALAGAIEAWSAAPRLSVAVALWATWAVGLVACLVPHPAALTTWRVLAPGAVVVVVGAAVGDRPSAMTTAIAAFVALVAGGAALSPATASVFVNGPAYPNERRYPLRPPGVVLVGPAALAWLAVLGGPTAAMLLLATRRWVAGGIAAVAGAAIAAIAGRALHGLSRRWLVFVPAGIVVHDPFTLADPVLFQKAVIDRLGPAPAEGDIERVDLTAGALGLALELRLRQPTG